MQDTPSKHQVILGFRDYVQDTVQIGRGPFLFSDGSSHRSRIVGSLDYPGEAWCSPVLTPTSISSKFRGLDLNSSASLCALQYFKV